jgi:putative spermidine/putrescine transport system ATP-binding protein
MQPYVEFKDVCKRFGDVHAVSDFSLAVARGQFVTLLGSSGSGKSTSLMMLAGFLKPDSGDIRIDSRDVVDVAPNRRNIGLVYQSYALFPHMTVAGNVGFPMRMRNVPRAEIAARVKEALRTVRLDDFGERYPSQLSGGQQQRVALARALVFSPAILLMDEPLGALDKNLREEMKIEIKRIQQTAGITTIYVTHDQEEAMSMSDVVVVMSNGRIEQAAPPVELYEQPANAFVANFIGSANVLPGSMVIDQGRACFVTEGGNTLTVTAAGSMTGGKKALVIRPERIAVGDPSAEGIPARIESVLYGGVMIRYVMRAGDERIDVLETNRGTPPRAVGDSVSLAWDTKDALLIDS